MATDDIIRIGGIFPFSLAEKYGFGCYSGGALRAASFLKTIEQLNDKDDLLFDNLLPGCFLGDDTGDSGFDENMAFTTAMQLFGGLNIPNVIIGPDTEDESSYASTAQEPNVAFISYSSPSTNLVIEEEFANFISVIPSAADYSQAMVSLILKNGWSRIGIVCSSDSDSTNFASVFSAVATSANIDIITETAMSDYQTVDEISSSLSEFRDRSVRVIVLLVSSDTAPLAIASLFHAGLTGNGMAQVIASPAVMMPSSYIRLAQEYGFSSHQIDQSMKGIVGFVPIGSESAQMQTFIDSLVSSPSIGIICPSEADYGGFSANTYTYHLHDHDGNVSTSDLCSFVDFDDITTDMALFDPFTASVRDAVLFAVQALHNQREAYLDSCQIDDDCANARINTGLSSSTSTCLTDEWFSKSDFLDELSTLTNGGSSSDISLNEYGGRNMQNEMLALLNWKTNKFEAKWPATESKYVTGKSAPYLIYPSGITDSVFEKVATFTFAEDVYTSELPIYAKSSSESLSFTTGQSVVYSSGSSKPLSDGGVVATREMSLAMQQGLYFVSGLLLGECLIFSVFLFYHRNHRAIRLNQVELLWLILLSGIFAAISGFFSPTVSDVSCITRTWFLHFAIAVMLTALSIKAYIVEFIFYYNNSPLQKKKYDKKTTYKALGAVCGTVFIILLAWTLSSPPKKASVTIWRERSLLTSEEQGILSHCGDDGLGDDCDDVSPLDNTESSEVTNFCVPGDSSILNGLRVLEIIGFIITGVLAWRVKNVSALLSESKVIIISIQLSFLTLIFVGPAAYFLKTQESYQDSEFVEWCSLVLLVTIIVFLLFIVKIYVVLTNVSIEKINSETLGSQSRRKSAATMLGSGFKSALGLDLNASAALDSKIVVANNPLKDPVTEVAAAATTPPPVVTETVKTESSLSSWFTWNKSATTSQTLEAESDDIQALSSLLIELASAETREEQQLIVNAIDNNLQTVRQKLGLEKQRSGSVSPKKHDLESPKGQKEKDAFLSEFEEDKGGYQLTKRKSAHLNS